MNQTATSAGPPQTRSGWVDERLRSAILTGELAPGSKLHGEQLSARWGVSVTPLREAFQRLAGEGLVVITPQRGARVAELDLDKVAEYYELRLLLEPQALEGSLRRADGGRDPVFRAEVHRTLDVLEAATEVVDLLNSHRDFHLALLSRCPNRELLRLCANLYDQTHRFRAGVGSRHDHDEVVAEHRAIVDAVDRGAADEAVRLLAEHIRRVAGESEKAFAAH